MFRFFIQQLNNETVRDNSFIEEDTQSSGRVKRNHSKPKKEPEHMIWFDVVYFKRDEVVSEAHEIVLNDPFKKTMDVRLKNVQHEHTTDMNTGGTIKILYTELVREPKLGPIVPETPTCSTNIR